MNENEGLWTAKGPTSPAPPWINQSIFTVRFTYNEQKVFNERIRYSRVLVVRELAVNGTPVLQSICDDKMTVK